MALDDFHSRYNMLNAEQRQAVDHIEGPVLVVAGPGTGKTELLTLRVANILLKSDARPENILCLTFTESAAYEMRQRLVNIVGQQAYNITISTYHAFGRELIARFPDYFSENAGFRAIDELGQHTIIESIIEELPYTNPLKKSSHYLYDVISTISDCKRALLSPSNLRQVALDNTEFMNTTSTKVSTSLSGIARISKSSIKAFESLAKETASFSRPKSTVVTSLSELWQSSLEETLEQVHETGKTTALTVWKNIWLTRNKDGQYIVAGKETTEKLLALADVYQRYLETLEQRALFDYDDMIIRTITGLEKHSELRYRLQEQYLYLLLDEFQDTNEAQFRLVQLLTDSPLHEGKPNVLAVGDDDQAIYAFQGADYSHMLNFTTHYHDVEVITLTANYRSHPEILHVAHNIASQIEGRLHHKLEGVDKVLTAHSNSLPEQATIERHEFKSDVAQYAWVAQKIASLIAEGCQPQEIAILAPQHKYLEPVTTYLRQAKIPMRYDKRENILEDTHIIQLERMSELVLALNAKDFAHANALWPEVLSYEFWNISTENIWQVSWEAFDNHMNWTTILIEQEWSNPIALFFVKLSNLVQLETLETLLDYLIGVHPLNIGSVGFISPFYAHNFSKQRQEESATSFWSLLSNLTVLRENLRQYRPEQTNVLMLEDFVRFVQQHKAADIKLLNTSPYHESAEAVQIMTAYKAKGLEFSHVFLLATLDEVWGSSSKGQSAKISLPPNLQFVRYQGAGEDERLRLLFVAITRAKHSLYMTSYEKNYANRPMSRLRFLGETEKDGVITSGLLPKTKQHVIQNDTSTPALDDLMAYWQSRHMESKQMMSLHPLLKPRLDRYQMAPTHVNSFTDTVYGGPEHFFMNTILRFPKAPSADGEYGNVMHELIEWIHLEQRRTHSLPSKKRTLEEFAVQLEKRQLSQHDKELLIHRGLGALDVFLSKKLSTFSESDEHEYNFRNQGVFVGDAHLTGKIDKLIINKTARTIAVVDYKTGDSFEKWEKNIKLHKYKQQLYMYKLLVEGSHQFADYTVDDAYLEFVEPNSEGEIVELHVRFDTKELQRIKKLIIATWQHIKNLNFPDVSAYSNDLQGTLQFEDDLIEGKI